VSATKCCVVIGPESSGTRLLTRLLVRMGCIGSGEHEQALDQGLPKADGTPVVWRRSYPHRGEWPDLGAMVKKAKAAKYEPVALVIVRDHEATARSQVAAPHVESYGLALANIAEAQGRVLDDVRAAKLDWRLVTYEGLIARPHGTLAWIGDWLGLPPVLGEALTDGNAKYLEAEPGVWR